MKKFLSILLTFAAILSVSAQVSDLYVGTYTARGSEGIYHYQFNLKTGALTLVASTSGITNPSFLAFSPDKNHLYAVAENDEGEVFSYQVDASGKLSFLNKQSAQGMWPCHIALDHSGKVCIVGNYGTGNICLLPVLPDGKLGLPAQQIQHKGKGRQLDRQEKAHVHSINISPDNRDVFVADLGIDKIMAYELTTDTHRLAPASPAFAELEPGSGPRHFAFHPKGKFAYAILELSGKVAAFKYQNRQLSPIQTIATLPADFKDKNTCADIHISADGKFLYGSNRGHNSIVIYKINQKTGALKLVGHQSVMGSTPRNFAIDPSGKFLLVANQESDNIQVFRRNKRTGKLKHLFEGAQVSMPVCLLFR